MKSQAAKSQRAIRLAAITRRMDDGMGVTFDDIGDPPARFAHFADGPYTRNVYTSESENPDPLYADWKRRLTWDLDENIETWPGGRMKPRDHHTSTVEGAAAAERFYGGHFG